MEFDYSELRGLIVTKYGSVANFCREHNFSDKNIYAKLNSNKGMRTELALSIAQALGIKSVDFYRYFFTRKV